MSGERSFSYAELDICCKEYKRQLDAAAADLEATDAHRAAVLRTIDLLSGAATALETLMASPNPTLVIPGPSSEEVVEDVAAEDTHDGR